MNIVFKKEKPAKNPPATANLVKVDHVHKEFYLGKTTVKALTDVSLQVEEGEFLSLSGPSGSGKTTLLNLMGALESPTKGRVQIDQKDVQGLTRKELAKFRSEKLGFIFQSFNLIPVLNAFENVEYPLIIKKMPWQERRQRVLWALSNVGLLTHLHHRPLELSGGQRQRVAVARAIVSKPRLILADEPTANLDHKTGLAILDLMKRINEEQKTTFIFSTHDPMVLARATRVIKIQDGQIGESQ